MIMAIGNRYNIQKLQSGYPSIGQSSFTLVASNTQIFLHSFSAFNANTSAIDVGLGVVQATARWKLLIGNVNNGTPTDKTSTIQAASSVNIFDTVANNGFMISSNQKFGYVAINLTQVQSGSPVYSYQYYNGSAWATLNLSQTPVYTSTGYIYIPFNPPVDWALGDGSLTANSLYSIRVRSTTAGGQAVIANAMRVARWYCYNVALPASSRLQVVFDSHPDLLENGEALVPYFQTANNLNAVEAAFQQMS